MGSCLELVMGRSWGEEKTESKVIYRKGRDREVLSAKLEVPEENTGLREG